MNDDNDDYYYYYYRKQVHVSLGNAPVMPSVRV